ncbi:MAG: O-antigen ligase family protein [candidate division Zixibacteria bacterium]|nr:O-antigen ligase family protein [candidate division Zixibacteria bacterium]
MNQTNKIWINAGYVCLAGFFLSTTFSKALAEVLMGAVLFAAVMLFILEKQYRRPLPRTAVFWFITSYVMWIIIATFFGTNPGHSLRNLPEERLFFCIPAVAVMITTQKRLFTLLDLFGFSVIFIAIYGLIQHFTGVNWYISEALVKAPTSGYRIQGFFSHVMTFGNFFGSSALLFLGCALYARPRKRRVYYYGVMTISGLTAILSYSRGLLGAVIFALIAFMFLLPRRFLKYTAGMVILFAALVYLAAPDILHRHVAELQEELTAVEDGTRIVVWKTAIRMIEAHPLFGVGKGNYKDNCRIYRSEKSRQLQTHAHNDWLNIAAVGGIPALILFVGTWLAVLVRMKTTIGRIKEPHPIRGVLMGCLLASLVLFAASFYEAIFDDIEIRLLLTGIWGLFFGAAALVKKNEETADDREIA